MRKNRNKTFAQLLLVTICLAGCGKEHDGEPLALEWTDSDSHLVFRVVEDPQSGFSLSWKKHSKLYVESNAVDRMEVIDDDASFSTVAFVRHDHWLLVVCLGLDEVWAGYE